MAEFRIKMSHVTSGKNNPMYGKCGENSPNYGRIHTEESKIKMSIGRSGKYTGEEHKNAVTIICINTNEIFLCMKYACKKYDIASQYISACCRHKQKSAGKHPETCEPLVWMYYDEYLKTFG